MQNNSSEKPSAKLNNRWSKIKEKEKNLVHNLVSKSSNLTSINTKISVLYFYAGQNKIMLRKKFKQLKCLFKKS